MERLQDPSSEDDLDEKVSPESIQKPVKASDPNQEKNAGFCSERELVVNRNICKELTSRRWIVIIAIIAFLVAVVGILSCKGSGNEIIQEREKELLKYLGYLKSQYGNQNQKLWNVVESQIAEYLNHSTAPLTIIMVYKEADKTAKLLAIEVSRVAVQLKHSSDLCGDTDLLKIEGGTSVIRKGYLLEEKLSSVSKCKKLLIFNVHNLQPSAAADLHSLLDPDFPNVKNAVYVFTVKVADESDRSIYHTVTNVLKDHWGSELHADILEPLLSRLVNFIMVEPEPLLDP